MQTEGALQQLACSSRMDLGETRINANGRGLTAIGMIRDCQMVSSRDGTSEVMSGLIRLLSLQYHDVCSADSQCLCPGSPPPQMADVACASVPASTAQRVTARAYHVQQEQTQDQIILSIGSV